MLGRHHVLTPSPHDHNVILSLRRPARPDDRPMNLQHVTLGSGSTLGGSETVISDAVRVGDLLFLSGRAPIDPTTLRLVADGFEEQAEAVLRDIGEVLEAAG